ncbi:MAG: hypothetical protein ACM3KD_03655 [Hyphomicrobiaceae bacterium]
MKPADRSTHRPTPGTKGGRHDAGIPLRNFIAVWLVPLSLCVSSLSLAAPVELGRLFYTPAQRAQLESARTRNVTQTAGARAPEGSDSTPPPLRYDGVLIRSDGKTTRWIDGKPQVGASGVSGLKPGQIRANGKVYEPYQVVQPAAPMPAGPDVEDAAP